ncbi:MAG: DUF5320 domain-containing protein [Lentimicrobium sp.]|jgi:hypothetical protein|nr:DUF5320 domain-containing protein [Lentimicrobium sp.]
MPGFNQQGPMGQGPMTGRKMGRCTNFGTGRRNQTIHEIENTENPTNDFFPGQGAGRGMGRGLGRGMGRNGGCRGMGPGRQNRFRGGM